MSEGDVTKEIEALYAQHRGVSSGKLKITDAELRSLMKHRMLALHAAVTDLGCLYEVYPQCNNLFEISRLIPMSLNEWDLELSNWIERFPGEVDPG